MDDINDNTILAVTQAQLVNSLIIYNQWFTHLHLLTLDIHTQGLAIAQDRRDGSKCTYGKRWQNVGNRD